VLLCPGGFKQNAEFATRSRQPAPDKTASRMRA
jgi:hypothetical protein